VACLTCRPYNRKVTTKNYTHAPEAQNIGLTVAYPQGAAGGRGLARNVARSRNVEILEKWLGSEADAADVRLCK